MNGLDWALSALLAFAAVRGFSRGFVVELASLLGIIIGIWVASRYNARVATWAGLDPAHEIIPFLITFIIVLVLVHLLAKVITKAMDMAMLGLPNKVAGTVFGLLRSAFVLSVLLNLLLVRPGAKDMFPAGVVEGSVLIGPMRALAPFVVPAWSENRWFHQATDEVG